MIFEQSSAKITPGKVYFDSELLEVGEYVRYSEITQSRVQIYLVF